MASLWARPGSSRELAFKLRELKAPADRVVMVGGYDYDLPFYAALTAPVLIVDNWDDPDIARRDNWRKEMTDAARFDPTMARQLLRLPSELDRLSCEQSAVWFVAHNGRAASIAALTGSKARVYQGAGGELWRVNGRKCLPFGPEGR